MTDSSPPTETWHTEFSVETTATPEAIWQLFVDVPGWKRWNADIERIELDGPFADGTWFTTTPPGREPFRSKLVDVRVNESFVDETRIDDLVVTVAHRLQRLDAAHTRVTYSVDAAGPGAAEVGPAVASDFPQVMAALVALATQVRP